MQNTNIELIEKARNYLEESQHEACFGALDTFFKKIQSSPESPINQLHNQLRRLKTRYHRLMHEQREGIIPYGHYDLMFNKISDALYAFFDSVIDETERLSLTEPSQKITHYTVNTVLILDENFDDFSEERAISIVNKLRNILNIDEKQFRYLRIEQGSVLIYVETTRNYEFIIKLKLLVQSNIIDNWVSIACDDVAMNKFCTAMKNLESDLSKNYLYQIKTEKSPKLNPISDSTIELIKDGIIREMQINNKLTYNIYNMNIDSHGLMLKVENGELKVIKSIIQHPSFSTRILLEGVNTIGIEQNDNSYSAYALTKVDFRERNGLSDGKIAYKLDKWVSFHIERIIQGGIEVDYLVINSRPEM